MGHMSRSSQQSQESRHAINIDGVERDFARRALAELHNIRGCDVHSTVILGPVDEAILRSLGAYVTCEPVFQTKRLYRKH